jgi:mono/diheme cytochrome c family protein
MARGLKYGWSIMKRTVVSLIGLMLTGLTFVQAAQHETPSPSLSPAATQRAFLNRYCVTCHNEKLNTAGLMLDKMDVENISEGAEAWEKVVGKLRTAAMPPAGLPRPDKAAFDSFATYLETALDKAAETKFNPGRPAIHRLNRAEYANAVRDLLGLEIDAQSHLPTDESG